MIRKYLRAMLKGSRKTKINLWSLFFIFLLAIFMGGFAILFGMQMIGFIGFLLALFGFIYSQTISFRDIEKEMEKKKEVPIQKEGKKSKKDKLPHGYSQYSQKNLEELFHKYKVSIKSREILIDYSEQYKIKCCPGYLWRDSTYLHFLLLEDTPRTVAIELKKLAPITYEKGVIVHSWEEEYPKLKEESLVQMIFKKYLPNYYKGAKGAIPVVMKNLYVIQNDIRVTAPSARNVFDIIGWNFQLSKEQIDREIYGNYFADAYQLHLFLKDEILNGDEYKQKLKELLLNLAKDDINMESFVKVIEQLVQYHLITHEYAEFFLEYRRKAEHKIQREK